MSVTGQVGHVTLMITRGTVYGRIGRVKTDYSEDEMPLDPAFAEILLRWKAHGAVVQMVLPAKTIANAEVSSISA